MAADFYLPPPPQRNWFQPIATGMQQESNLADQSAKRNWFNQQVQQQQQQRAALQQGAQTGDYKALMASNPALAKQATDVYNWYQTQKDPVQKDIMNLTSALPSMSPMINSQSWKTLRPQIMQSYPNIPKEAIPPENATDQQLFQFANHAKILDMQLKQMGQGPKVLKGGDVLAGPGGNVLAKAPLTPLQEAQLLKARTGAQKDISDIQDPSRKWKPERYVPDKGEGLPVWIKPGDTVPPGYVNEKQKIASASDLDLTPDAIEQMARRYILDGTMPGLGLGKAATKARSMVMNRVPEIMAAEGMTPQGAVANKMVYGSLKSAFSKLEGQRAPMLAFAETADKNLDLASSLSQKVGRTGSPVLNRWILAGRKSVAGDADVAAFDASVRVAINEFAKVTSSATGGGVTSDQARKDIENILYSAQTPQQFNEVEDPENRYGEPNCRV